MEPNVCYVTREERDAIFALVDGSEMGVISAVQRARRMFDDKSITQFTRFVFYPWDRQMAARRAA